jgi:hypothetical protein
MMTQDEIREQDREIDALRKMNPADMKAHFKKKNRRADWDYILEMIGSIIFISALIGIIFSK